MVFRLTYRLILVEEALEYQNVKKNFRICQAHWNL